MNLLILRYAYYGSGLSLMGIPSWSLYNSTLMTPPKPYSNYSGAYIGAILLAIGFK